jgi:hypothetical protein
VGETGGWDFTPSWLRSRAALSWVLWSWRLLRRAANAILMEEETFSRSLAVPEGGSCASGFPIGILPGAGNALNPEPEYRVGVR